MNPDGITGFSFHRVAIGGQRTLLAVGKAAEYHRVITELLSRERRLTLRVHEK